MKALAMALFGTQVPTPGEADVRALVSIPRDGLTWFLINHAPCCTRGLPDALAIWVEGGATRGWCRQCGAAEQDLDVGDLAVESPLTWWLVVALALVARHRDLYTDDEGNTNAAYRDGLARIETAVQRAVLLGMAGRDGQVH